MNPHTPKQHETYMRARNKVNFCPMLRSSPTASSLDGVRSWQLQRGFRSSGTISCTNIKRTASKKSQNTPVLCNVSVVVEKELCLANTRCRPKLDSPRQLARRLHGFQFEAAGSKVRMPAAENLQVQCRLALPALDLKSKLVSVGLQRIQRAGRLEYNCDRA